MPDESYTQLPFVGREDVLARFRAMVDDPDGPWLFFVIGPAGQGKSRVLEAILKEYDRPPFLTSGLFDFFTDEYRTRQGVLEGLARAFGQDKAEAFETARQAYQEAYERNDRAGQALELRHLETALVQQLRELQARGAHLLIVADTIELISPLRVGDWFFNDFLTQLAPGAKVIAGGRIRPIRLTDEVEDGTISVDLVKSQLSRDNVYEFLKNQVPDAAKKIDAELKTKIYDVTSGRHQPLMMALIADALSGKSIATYDYSLGRGFTLENLRGISREELQQLLVDGPLLQKQPATAESKVVLALTHLYHGIDPGMLQSLALLEEGEIDDVELHRRLRRLPYVKFHSESQIVRVHDYFRERALEVAWVDQDPGLVYRQRLSARMASYFEQVIASEPTRVSPRLDRLRQQWLYHLLFADRERAYGELWGLLDEAWHHYRFDYMDALLDMADQVNKILERIGQFDSILDRLAKAAQAWIDQETGKLDKALGLAEDILHNDAGVSRLHLTALVVKGTVLGLIGQVDNGISLLQSARSGYDKLLQLSVAAETGNPAAQETIRAEHGLATAYGIRPERYLVLNTIGYFERNRGRFIEAEQAYRESYRLSSEEGDQEWQASSATQLGSSLYYMGRISGAFDWITRGLALRKRSGIPENIAYSLTALGRVQRETNHLDDARHSFEQARDIFTDLDAKQYLADVEAELGLIEVLANRHDSAKEHFDKAEALYLHRGMRGQLPMLREKQGLLFIAQARQAEDQTSRGRFLDQASTTLEDGYKLGIETGRDFYTALCLVALCRVSEMRGEWARVYELARKVISYQEQGYLFRPAYANVEEILGDAALKQLEFGEPNFNFALFDEATDHYLQMFQHLVRHTLHGYRNKRQFLRNWLPSLPPALAKRAGRRLIAGWQRQPDNLAVQHPGFIRTVCLMSGLDASEEQACASIEEY